MTTDFSTREPLITRLKAGARNGFYVAIGLTIIAVVVAGIATASDPNALDDLPAPLGAFIVLYFAIGVSAGAAYEGLKPLTKSLVGAIAAGILLASLGVILLGVVVELVEAQGRPLRLDVVFKMMAMTSPLLGPVIGLVLWARHRGGNIGIVVPACIVIVALAVKIGLSYLEAHANAQWWQAIPVVVPAIAAPGLALVLVWWRRSNRRGPS